MQSPLPARQPDQPEIQSHLWKFGFVSTSSTRQSNRWRSISRVQKRTVALHSRREGGDRAQRSVIGRRRIVQHDTEESIVHLESAVVVDEPELPELVHEEIHA